MWSGSTLLRRSHEKAVDWQSITLPGPEGFMRVKSKSVGALRRRGGFGFEEQEEFPVSPDSMKLSRKYDGPSWVLSDAGGVPLKKSSSSKKLVVGKIMDEVGDAVDCAESDDTEMIDKKNSRKLRSLTRKQRHAGAEMMRSFRKGVPLELQQLGPRTKSASSLHDFVSSIEAADLRISIDQPVSCSEEAEGSTMSPVDVNTSSQSLHSMELAEASAALEEVHNAEMEHSKQKSSQKNKKSKKNKGIPASPGAIRAQPGDLLPLVEHDDATEVAQVSLREASEASFPDPPAPQALTNPSSPKPPTSSPAQSFASLRTMDIPKQVSRTLWNVSNEAICKNDSVATIDAILAPDKVRRPSSAAVGDDAFSIWDDCKEMYSAWGDADHDWGQDFDEWPSSGATLAWA